MNKVHYLHPNQNNKINNNQQENSHKSPEGETGAKYGFK